MIFFFFFEKKEIALNTVKEFTHIVLVLKKKVNIVVQ